MSQLLKLYDGYRNNPQLNPQVKELQQQLKQLGYDVDTDGKFGPGTEKAVKQFQQSAGLKDDGIVGNDTYKALDAAISKGNNSQTDSESQKTSLSEQQLQQIMPQASSANIDRYYQPLLSVTTSYNIDTPLRLAHFIAQIAHESGSLRYTEENLNYSASALRSVFGKYFKTDDEANAYARQPEKIANRVYANRMGNGDEASGEGWKYRGRGLIQLTGKENYSNFGKSVIQDLITNPDPLAKDPTTAVEGACWYWDNRKLNQYADQDDIVTITKKINGGLNGLEDRKAFLVRAKQVMGLS